MMTLDADSQTLSDPSGWQQDELEAFLARLQAQGVQAPDRIEEHDDRT